MNYELAKKLKDAQFPQDKGFQTSFFFDEVEMTTPTLEELIEACGEGFHELHSNTTIIRLDPFICQGLNGKGEIAFSSGGETPLEAVANLWLKLNQS